MNIGLRRDKLGERRQHMPGTGGNFFVGVMVIQSFNQNRDYSFALVLGLLLIGFCFSPVDPVAANDRLLAEVASPDGRVAARLTISPAEPKLSDTIRLLLVVEADDTLRVTLPDFGEKIGELKIARRTDRVASLGAKEETRLVLDLVPTRGGTMPVWPISIRYVDSRPELSDKVMSITLPASQFEVKAEISPETASLDQIRSTAKLLEPSSGIPLWMIFVALILLAALMGFILLRRKKEHLPSLPTLSPREVALKRLENLLESRLQESDVKKFFIELTGIVRWYIEQQTDIRAPELTTEEFLREITSLWKSRGAMTPELRDRLRLFLESSDMVKFAKFKPTRDEIMLGVRRAEEFVNGFETFRGY